MAVSRFLRSQPALPTVRLVGPPQSAIELAMDVVAVLDGWIVHLARLGALKFNLMIGAKPF